MNMNTGILIGAALLLAPMAAFAANYHYVDTSGTVRTITADSAIAAMNQAPNIAPTSGVTLDMGVLESGDSVMGPGSGGTSVAMGTNQYHYVDTTNTVRTVTANNAAEAFNRAVNIAPTSGVTRDMGILKAGDSVSGN